MQKLILVDFLPPKNWEIHKAIEHGSEEKWEIVYTRCTHLNGWKNIIRYFKYSWLPFRIFLQRKKYDTVLAWQQFFGLFLGFYLRLFRVKNGPDVSVMTFIYKAKRSLPGKLYFAFVRYAINSKYIKNVFVHSESEKEYYSALFGVSKDCFKAVVLGNEDIKDRIGGATKDKDYFVSAGRSNRDYAFLVDVWKTQNRKLRIICDTIDLEEAENIEYLKNCFGKNYLKELAECHAVIIPLWDENVSSGQLVLLHAMMLGKPVIITKNNALQEYIQDGRTGFVINKTEAALANVLEKLDDDTIYNDMARESRAYYEQNYTPEIFGQKIGRILVDK